MENAQTQESDILLTAKDIYRAVDENVLASSDAQRLIEWGYEQKFNPAKTSQAPPIEERKGFNLVTVVYYFGAMLMISACAWFLGDKWDVLGSRGVFITVLMYIISTLGIGFWLRKKEYPVGGGLLITVAVSLVPLLTYTVQDMLGLWTLGNPGEYKEFYPRIHASWIVMELATIAAASIALYFVRFPFLTAPLAFSFWFLSMDVAHLIFQEASLNWNRRMWVSIVVGLAIMLIGYFLEKTMRQKNAIKSEDFAFWCYLFGLLAFWGGLTGMNSQSEVSRVVYALINIGLIFLAVKLRRVTFLVFGAFGVHIYLGHLAYTVFANSLFFPFVLALLGLSMILITVWIQQYMRRAKAVEI